MIVYCSVEHCEYYEKGGYCSKGSIDIVETSDKEVPGVCQDYVEKETEG